MLNYLNLEIKVLKKPMFTKLFNHFSGKITLFLILLLTTNQCGLYKKTDARKGDLVFFRRTPDAVQRIIDGKKSKDDETVSKRLLPYADPKLYRVKDITPYGLYHLEDPATGEPVATYKNTVSLDRLILYGDLPPQEQPLNPDEEVWIEIKSNDNHIIQLL